MIFFSPCFFVIVADHDFCINEESMEKEGEGECVSLELIDVKPALAITNLNTIIVILTCIFISYALGSFFFYSFVQP